MSIFQQEFEACKETRNYALYTRKKKKKAGDKEITQIACVSDQMSYLKEKTTLK